MPATAHLFALPFAPAKRPLMAAFVRRLILSLGLSFLGTTLMASEAASADLLRAVAEAPALTAASRRATAARERLGAAGRLRDPEVEGMASRMNGPMGERGTMYELNVRQPLPRKGERAADRERAQAGIALADADFALLAGEIAAETTLALAEADGAQQRIRVLETQLGRLDAALRSLEVRLAAGGTVRLADRLTLQTRSAALQLLIEEDRRLLEDALAAARGRLGLPPAAPLPAYHAPTATQIVPAAAAAIQQAAARADEAAAMARVARASGQPMTAVGLRLERERTGMGDENTVGIAFMSEIPWRSRGYARAEVRAAEAERAAAQSDASALRFRIATALARVERAARLADTARRLAAETRARLEAQYDSLLRSAGVGSTPGESTVLQAVDILEQVSTSELQVIRADTDLRAAQAELWRYAPVEQLSSILSRDHP